MKLKPILTIFTPPAVGVAAVAILNPAALTWPVVGLLAVVVGIFGGVAMHLFDS